MSDQQYPVSRSPSNAIEQPFAAAGSVARFASRLLRWFDEHHRDLPWRNNRNAYRIWVSEVMLQQTTVEAVRSYFERFLQAFPDVVALASAEEAEVLKLWEGLGYYRRARHLHKSAQILVEQYGGELPDDPAVWESLPGVGKYILGAVLSQAFDRRLPIVEANTLRVLCRLFGYEDDPRSGPGQRWLWQMAEQLLPKKRIGDFNQAMMELGALICTPTRPKCDECPVAANCLARQRGLQATIPLKAERPVITAIEEVALVVRREDRLLLVQRPADAGRWAGLWEFPHTELNPDETHDRAANRLAASLGLKVRLGPELTTIRHSVTRYAIRLVALTAEYRAGEFSSSFYSRGEWIARQDITALPTSSPQRKLFRAAQVDGESQRLF